MSKPFILLGVTLLAWIIIPSTLGGKAEVQRAQEILQEAEKGVNFTKVEENETCSDSNSVDLLEKFKADLTTIVGYLDNTTLEELFTAENKTAIEESWGKLKNRTECKAGADLTCGGSSSSSSGTIEAEATTLTPAPVEKVCIKCGKNPKCSRSMKSEDLFDCFEDACPRNHDNGGNILDIPGLGVIFLAVAIASSNSHFLLRSR